MSKNYIVKPIKIGGGTDPRPILGSQLIPYLYSTIYLVARKNTGKTTVINALLEECAGPSTTVIVFCSTLYNDPSWQAIKQGLKSRGIKFKGYTSLTSPDGENRLKKWMVEQVPDGLESDDDSDNDESAADSADATEPVPAPRTSNVHLLLESKAPAPGAETKKVPRKRKSKFQEPNAIIVFDDLSDELKSPVVPAFIKKHRHFKTKVIISSQNLKDIKPEVRRNIDIWLLFRGLDRDLLESVHTNAGLGTDFDDFVRLYKKVTTVPGVKPEHVRNFLYVDTRVDKYRKNFETEPELVL